VLGTKGPFETSFKNEDKQNEDDLLIFRSISDNLLFFYILFYIILKNYTMLTHDYVKLFYNFFTNSKIIKIYTDKI